MANPIRAFVGRRTFSGQYAVDYSDRQMARNLQSSLGNVLGNLRNWISHMHEASADIVASALEPTFEKSQDYCPVDSGELKESGYLETRRFRGKSVAEIGYARGGKPDYAIYVHERPDLAHAAPTRSKFLQAAIEEDIPQIQQRIIDGALRASGVNG